MPTAFWLMGVLSAHTREKLNRGGWRSLPNLINGMGVKISKSKKILNQKNFRILQKKHITKKSVILTERKVLHKQKNSFRYRKKCTSSFLKN